VWTITIGGNTAGINPFLLSQLRATATAVTNYYSRFIDDSIASIDIRFEFPFLDIDPQPLHITEWNLHHSTNGVDYFESNVVTELKTGTDLNGASPDIIINFDYSNFRVRGSTYFEGIVGGVSGGYAWNSISDAIWHALGFESFRLDSATQQTTFDEFLVERLVAGVYTYFDFVFPDGRMPPLELRQPNSVPNGDWTHFSFSNSVTGSHFLSIQDIEAFREIGVPLKGGPTGGDDLLYALREDYYGYGANAAIDGLGGDDTIVGIFGDDILTGGSGNDSLLGWFDDDTLNGGVGKDTLRGGDGDDNLVGGPGADVLDGGSDYFGHNLGDIADYSSSPAAIFITIGGTVTGGDATGDKLIEIEGIRGSVFDDQITGDSARNFLIGDLGADLLIGGDGDDWLYGVDSNYNPDGSSDTLIGGAGADIFYGDLTDVISYSTSPVGVHFEIFSPSTLGIIAQHGDAAGDTIFYASPIRILEGSEHNDTLGGGRRFGLGGEVYGLGGNDRIFGLFEPDKLDGGDGNDTINAGDAADTLIGGNGDDILRGEVGADQLYAGLGNDSADGGEGDDFIRTSNGNDTLLGGVGIDTLGAGSGADLMRGGDDADLLLGSNGKDRLYGDNGDDTILGGGGRDTITGGLGDDRLVGGSHNDRFTFTPGTGADLIVDFVAGAGSDDVIGLIGWGAAFDSFTDVMNAASQVGGDVVINLGGGDSITLQDVTLASLHADDFAFG